LVEHRRATPDGILQDRAVPDHVVDLGLARTIGIFSLDLPVGRIVNERRAVAAWVDPADLSIGSTLERSWGLLGPSGRLVTIAASGDATDDERVKNAFFIVEPDRVQLCKVSALLNSGDLRSVVDVEVPFDQADRAYTRQTAPTRGCGKSVVTVVPT
jgi:NADPH:quinone reductase-like Zn-dependent oxidoreductase